jgi:small subunit ribosomal protein S19
MRSTWKMPYVDYIIKNLFMKNWNLENRTDIETADQKQAIIFFDRRASTILSNMIGKKVAVHNGQGYSVFTIRDYMVGHKYGEFSFTRKVGIDMHFRKKGKKAMNQPITKKKK